MVYCIVIDSLDIEPYNFSKVFLFQSYSCVFLRVIVENPTIVVICGAKKKKVRKLKT